MTIQCIIPYVKTVLTKHGTWGSEKLSVAGKRRVKILRFWVRSFHFQTFVLSKSFCSPLFISQTRMGLCHPDSGRTPGTGDIDFRSSEEELKSLLMKVKEEEWKSWLKAEHSENEDHGIWSHHFMGNRWGNSVRLYFWGLQNHTAHGDCSHEIKRRLLLGRKVITNLDSISKTLPTKVRLVKAMIFPVVMCGCESWTVKKAECWRIDALELWCWRRLLQGDPTSPF